MKTLFAVLGVIVCFGLLQVSCENMYEKSRQIKRTHVINPTVSAAGVRLQVVGQVPISGNCGTLAPERAAVFLLADSETEETYLVGLDKSGIVALSGHSVAVRGGER